jgi:elongation factor P--beta-lysine ligase
MMSNMLEIDGVTTAYDKADVLQGVSLAVKAGSITCLLGSNGSGKTTLVRSILGLTPARAGRIIFDHYPLAQATLARPARADPRVAERFELYVCGVEVANAFGELTDAAEQRRRFELEMAEKQRRYGERYPVDEDFLAALAHMPQACGSALGFDRLVMLVTGASRIDQVIWTPMPEPE